MIIGGCVTTDVDIIGAGETVMVAGIIVGATGGA